MSDHGHATKHPRLVELEEMVRDGRIDTIVVAITDMQGRLMGKRVQGQAFLDGVISHGAHFCTYLLGTDMEMNTPEGFKLMNWETGYGDWIAEPIWDQLRVLPWLPGTAHGPRRHDRRGDREGDPGLAADDPQAPGRARGQGRLRAQGRLRVRVLRARRTRGRNSPSAGWPVPRPFGHYNEDYHLLQATKAEPLHRLLRNQMTAANVPIEFSKGEAANGQHEVNIRYDHVLESADRSVRLQARRQGDRLPQRLGHHVHGQARPSLDGVIGSPAHEPVGRGEGRPADVRPDRQGEGRPVRPLGDRPALRGRDDEAVARAGRLHRAVHQLVQALRVAVVGAGQRRLGPRQPHDRVPPRRTWPRRSTSRTASPAAT